MKILYDYVCSVCTKVLVSMIVDGDLGVDE